MARPESPPGSGWAQNVRNFQDLFTRWGGAGDNIRGLLNLAIPTVVVDRFRDDSEGSIYGITAFTNGANSEFSSVAFGSAENDWEIHAVTCVIRLVPAPPNFRDYGWHMFTPIAPYNPVLNLNPVGFFQPGLINNRAFTFGTVNAIGGTNPAFPGISGPIGWLQGLTGSPNFRMMPLDVAYRFDPPLRIPRDVTFTVQNLTTFVDIRQEIHVSLLYNERPRR